MSSSTSPIILFYQTTTKDVYIFFGSILLITGIIGELLNLIIFQTLRVFRESPGVFYLRIMSLSNIGQILVAVLFRTLNYGFQINLLRSSWICKTREFLVHFCALVSLTSICLATIDQYLSLTRPNLSQMKYSYRHGAIMIVLWLLHNVPFLIYCDMVSGSCRNSSTTFSTYANYFIWPVLLGCLPVAIMLIFAILSYISVRKMSKAQVNATRLSHERQITSMVLVYVVFIIVFSLPCILYSIYALNPPYTDTESTARGRLTYGLLSFFYYESYAVRNSFSQSLKKNFSF